MPEVHLLNPFANACGGSEWRAISLFELLAEHADVSLWAMGEPDSRLLGKFPFRRIDVDRRALPRSGNLVLVGTYVQAPDWVRRCEFDRIVIVHNIPEINDLRRNVESIKTMTTRPIEVICACKAQVNDLEGLDVIRAGVESSWIDIERFRPPFPALDRPFTIGRMNRDSPEKFHSGDPELYRRLADDGIHIRIMGGTLLRDRIGVHPNIELLPAGAVAPEDFLHSLDAMIYRTSDDWFESFGRSIAEGMACGVVPVAFHRGGYADFIRHGFDGFLYDADDEAIMWLDSLRADSELRRAMARAARAGMEEMYGPASRTKLIEFYTRKQALKPEIEFGPVVLG